MKRKSARTVGELSLIEHIRQEFAGRHGRAVRLGIGDDCAILRPSGGSEVLVTTDFSLEDRHFRRDWHSPESVGYRCLARGLSDLAAMGATPMAAFLSLALPKATSRNWTDRFFEGLRTLADRYKVPLAGGDTAQCPAELILADIVLIGTAPAGRALLRSGARAGDRLYVTGTLGGGLAELEEMRAGRTRRVRTGSSVLHPHMFPEPRLAVGQWLLAKGLATACMDLSDGLSTDLAHLCKASGVGAEVEDRALPVHPMAVKLGAERALSAALHGGDDYELLFTAPAEKRVPPQIAGVAISPIGRMTKQQAGVVRMQADGTRVAFPAEGWEHFKN